jgi:hypothetical protein
VPPSGTPSRYQINFLDIAPHEVPVVPPTPQHLVEIARMRAFNSMLPMLRLAPNGILGAREVNNAIRWGQADSARCGSFGELCNFFDEFIMFDRRANTIQLIDERIDHLDWRVNTSPGNRDGVIRSVVLTNGNTFGVDSMSDSSFSRSSDSAPPIIPSPYRGALPKAFTGIGRSLGSDAIEPSPEREDAWAEGERLAQATREVEAHLLERLAGDAAEAAAAAEPIDGQPLDDAEIIDAQVNEPDASGAADAAAEPYRWNRNQWWSSSNWDSGYDDAGASSSNAREQQWTDGRRWVQGDSRHSSTPIPSAPQRASDEIRGDNDWRCWTKCNGHGCFHWCVLKHTDAQNTTAKIACMIKLSRFWTKVLMVLMAVEGIEADPVSAPSPLHFMEHLEINSRRPRLH